MPSKKSRKQLVAERTEARLAEKRQRREQAAQERQTRAEAKQVAPKEPAAAENAPKAPRARQERERVHSDMVTVAIRGEFAEQMRGLAAKSEMSLGNLLRDMLMKYGEAVDAGYQPNTRLRQWREDHARERAAAR